MNPIRLRNGAALLAALACVPPTAHAQGDLAELSIAEVFYDATGSDDAREWVELVNDGAFAVDLSTWSLGWGGSDYASGLVGLDGVIDAGARFVVGGPLSGAENASPVFDLGIDFEPDLQNSGATADGVALFDLTVEEVGADSVPVAVVVYGETNTSGLIDETGAIATVDVGDAPGGSSIERGADGVWRVQAQPTPGEPPRPVPEPTHVAIAAAGVVALCGLGLVRHK